MCAPPCPVAHILLEFGLGRILWKRERRGVHAVREGEEEARDDGVLIGRHPDDIGLPANAAAWTLVHACHGAGGSEGTRLLLAGQVRAQEGRQATRARGALRRGQCWIRWNVGRAAGVQAQSAQGMGAQKRGAAPPLGSGKARGVGVRRRGAAQHSTMVRVGIRAPVLVVECSRAKDAWAVGIRLWRSSISFTFTLRQDAHPATSIKYRPGPY